MHFSLNVTLFSGNYGIFNGSNHIVRVVLVGLGSSHKDSIFVKSISHQLLLRGSFAARLERACHIEINQIARSVWECHIYVHCDKLALMRILGDESILLNVRLHIFVDFVDCEHHNSGQRKHRNDTTNDGRFSMLRGNLSKVI